MQDVSATDAALARRACAGEVEAIAGLLERYRPSLYGAAIGLLRNREDALDAVQETCVVALARFGSLRDPSAVGAWLHAVLRNACFMRLRSVLREISYDGASVAAVVPGPEELLEQHALRDWVWGALDTLDAEDRATVMLRDFTRCHSYRAIAAITDVPIGTVRSRLHRARSQLNDALSRAVAGTPLSQADLEETRRAEWEDFYAALHEAPVPRTYRDVYAADVEVTDRVGRWHGLDDWSAHEREAILLGVRARVVGVAASRDVTILEIDFHNPAWASDHCPPRSTFVHRLTAGRSRRLDIHYV